MPGGRHRHKSQTQDGKEKGKKRRPSKESGVSPQAGPCMSTSSSDSSQLSPNECIDYMGIISEFLIQLYNLSYNLYVH